MTMFERILRIVSGGRYITSGDPLLAVAGVMIRDLRHHYEHAPLIGRMAYIAQLEHLRIEGTALFQDDIRATARGPQVTRLLKDLERRHPMSADPIHMETLTPSQRSVVQDVCRRYPACSHIEIMSICDHPEGPYSRTYRSGLGRRYANDDGPVISVSDMLQHCRSMRS